MRSHDLCRATSDRSYSRGDFTNRKGESQSRFTKLSKSHRIQSSLDQFHHSPVYRYARRPNTLFSQLYGADRIELKRGEMKKLLFILTVTPEFFQDELDYSDVYKISLE